MKGIVPCLTAMFAALALAGCAGPVAARPTPTSTASVNPGGPVATATPTSPSITPSATVQPTAPATAAAADTRCLVPQLSASLGSNRGLASAGHRGQIFVLTNVSGQTCYLHGYPGMDILDAKGQSLDARMTWNGPAPTLVRLAPGGEASFVAEWADPGMYPKGCPTGTSIEITPPNAYRHLTMSFAMPRCPDGIQAHAVVAGTGGGIS